MSSGVLYASIAQPFESCSSRLATAIHTLLRGSAEQPPHVLWSMQYYQTCSQPAPIMSAEKNVIIMPPVPLDLALPDSLLDDVKNAWQKITLSSEDTFLAFEAREGAGDEDSF